MSLTISFFLAAVFICEGLHVLGPSGPLTVELGGSLMLPCYVESPLPLEELEVAWKRTGSESLVHLFQDGESRPEAQSQAYSGRARFFTEEIKHGNFSLLLTDLTSKDAGVYSCTVYRQQETGQASVEIKDVEHLIVTGSQVTGAYVGEVITLSCSVDSHIPPEELSVSWKKVDQQIPVLIFQDGTAHQESTHERYINRVEFFGPEEIRKGNFSLRLKDLQTEDEGLYICEVFYGQVSANTTMKVRELGFSSVHIGILCLCVLANGFPLLMSFLLCIVLNDLSGHFAFVFGPNIALFLAFILWGGIDGFFAEAATCSALNLLRIVFLIWMVSGFKIFKEFFVMDSTKYTDCEDCGFCCICCLLLCLDAFKEIFRRVSKRSAFTLAYAVISTLAYSGLFWQLYQESKNTEILIAVGFLLILMLLFYIWILVHGFLNLKKGGLLNYILPEIINVGRGIIVVFLYGRNTVNFVMIILASLLLWTCFCGLPYLSKRKQRSLVLIWMTVVLILEGLNASLSVYIHNVVLKSDKEHIGLTCVTAYLYVLTMMLLFEYLCIFYESISSDTQPSLGLSHSVMYMLGAVGLTSVNAIALAVEVIVNATQRDRERTVEDLRVILVPFECAFLVCCFTQQTATFWRKNRKKLKNDPNECRCKQPAENSVASREAEQGLKLTGEGSVAIQGGLKEARCSQEPSGETVALQPLKSNEPALLPQESGS